MTGAAVLAASTSTSTGEAVTFWVLAPVAVLAALGVLFSKKAVHSALLLAATMLCLAILYLAQDAPFLGVVQVVVYTGAVMMLFLFVLMLVGVDSADSLVETLRGQRVAAIVAALGFGGLLVFGLGDATVSNVGLTQANQDGNVQGLADLMGGDKAFVDRLDSIFSTPPLFDDSYYGGTIHEIREMQIVNMGQYAHGNQPIQHMTYLYDWAGAPWKTQFHVRDVMAKLYSSAPDGYPGDEDNGQTSAWYVFSAMGFYPVTPAVGEYAIGSPLFQNVELTMPGGRKLKIEAVNNGPKNVYIQSVTFNGKRHDKTWLTRAALQGGGTLRFAMGPTPNKQWGADKASAPFSMSASGERK